MPARTEIRAIAAAACALGLLAAGVDLAGAAALPMMAGSTPALLPALMVASTVRPRLAALVASIRRSTGASKGAPTPTLWLRIRLSCSCCNWSLAMRVLANLPKPVLTP